MSTFAVPFETSTFKTVQFIDNTERKRTRGKAKDRVSLNKKLSKTEFSDYNFNRQEQE